MRRRAVRAIVLAILLAGGVAAGLQIREIDRHAERLRAAQQDIDARLTRLSDTLAAMGEAQRAYVAPGQLDESWFQEISTLVENLRDQSTGLHSHLSSGDAAAALQALDASTTAFVDADRRARENLRLDQDLMAADVIFTDGRGTLEMMRANSRNLRSAAQAAYTRAGAAMIQERWTVLGGIAALWTLGIILLLPAGAPKADDTAAAESPARLVAPEPVQPAKTTQPTVDLGAVAALCGDLSRVTAAAALPDLLARTAAILEASGVIVWMGAGEELFPVLAHGYPQPLVAQLGPIRRTTDNATAAAWRDGRTVVVPAHGEGQGAIVTPMFSPEGCAGVLALEVRSGREQDVTKQAAARIIAAQLAAAISAWPAASAGGTEIFGETASEPLRDVAI